MNSRQLQYAILLGRIRNFSQVAEQLKITQPALSKQILSLEQELGVKLFDRSTNPVTVTAAGAHFLREAQELLYREDQLQRSMERYRSGEEGELVIGSTPFRSSYLIPDVVRRLRLRYPGVRVRIVEAGSEILRREVAEGRYDLAVVNLPVDSSVLEVTAMEPDRLALVLRRELLTEAPELADADAADFARCGSLAFVVVSPAQEMRRLFEQLCARAGIRPRIAAEVVGLTTAWDMARAGVGATMLPLQFVERSAGQNMVILPLEGVSYSRQPAVVTRRGQYLSEAARYAIVLLTGNEKGGADDVS